jgi:hypothetical protein
MIKYMTLKVLLFRGNGVTLKIKVVKGMTENLSSVL